MAESTKHYKPLLLEAGKMSRAAYTCGLCCWHDTHKYRNKAKGRGKKRTLRDHTRGTHIRKILIDFEGWQRLRP